MRKTVRAALCMLLAGLSAAPANAQIAIPPAAKGESVAVTLCDGRTITGHVGEWLGDLGFYVKPPDTAAYLIHREDVVSIRDAATAAPRSLPVRQRHRMSGATKAAIAAAAVVGAVVLLRFNFFQPMG